MFTNITSKPVTTEHICYYTTEGDADTIYVHEVVKNSYQHPDSIDDTIIIKLEINYNVKKIKKVSKEAKAFLEFSKMQELKLLKKENNF